VNLGKYRWIYYGFFQGIGHKKCRLCSYNKVGGWVVGWWCSCYFITGQKPSPAEGAGRDISFLSKVPSFFGLFA